MTILARSPAQAQAAVDALRAGVVNRFIARHFTYGRGAELRKLEAGVRKSEGSAQVVVGGYGVGKSHLCEVLALRLMAAGYAVAHLEMGASHGRAENPRGVLRTIGQNLRVQIADRVFTGESEISLLLRAMEDPHSWDWDGEIRTSALKRFRGRKNAAHRYDLLREEWERRRAGSWFPLMVPSLFDEVPSAMTAANMAVREVNRVAHRFVENGFKGLVILFDEAERSEWAESAYRMERARDVMLGFALASANKSTGHLKHYRNDTWRGYLESKPSHFHSIFFFTRRWGLAAEIAQEVSVDLLTLPPLSEAARIRLREKIQNVYRHSYRTPVTLDEKAQEIIREFDDYEDVRSMVRATVAALDYKRWRKELRNGRR